MEISSILSSTSPTSTYKTLYFCGFSFKFRGLLVISCSIMSNFADRLRLKLCRESTTATNFLAMSTNEISTGSSTPKRALGTKVLLFMMKSVLLYLLTSTLLSSTLNLSTIRMGFTSSSMREPATDSIPAFSSVTAKLNSYPTCCHSNSCISAYRPR